MNRSKETHLPIGQILEGDCIQRMQELPEKCVDLIFADPPYNLQLQQDLYRPNMTLVDAVQDDWDHFDSLQQYDEFTRTWLTACRRILKDDGAIWVIGTYHNIFRLGYIMQDLDFWFLNDIIWIKTNPMPNFKGVRFTNAHETLIWAAKSRRSRCTFNHHAMKTLNDDLQMRSDWLLPICSGSERLREEGRKIHSTQKPEALLYRVLLATSNPGDLVLDPFFGSGTTGVVARRLNRRWIGIESRPDYIRTARKRIEAVAKPIDEDDALYQVGNRARKPQRIPFGHLLENGLLQIGQNLYLQGENAFVARICADGSLLCGILNGSIHHVASELMEGKPCNGWDVWFYEENGERYPIDCLRQKLRI